MFFEVTIASSSDLSDCDSGGPIACDVGDVVEFRKCAYPWLLLQRGGAALIGSVSLHACCSGSVRRIWSFGSPFIRSSEMAG